MAGHLSVVTTANDRSNSWIEQTVFFSHSRILSTGEVLKI